MTAAAGRPSPAPAGVRLRGPAGTVVGIVPHVIEIVRADGRVEVGHMDVGAAGASTRAAEDGCVEPSDVEITTRAGDFSAVQQWSTPDGDGRWLVRIVVSYEGTDPVDASLRVAVVLEPDDAAPWWLIPGAFYGENRPAGCERVFPRFEIGADDPAAMVSDHWEFRADRCATPAVFAWTSAGGVGLVVPETTALGMAGIGLAHDRATRRGRVHVTYPFREEPISYDGSAVPRPAEVRTRRWMPGEQVTIEVGVYTLGADRHAYAPILRAEHRRMRTAAPLAPWVDVATAADLAAEGLWRWHFAEPGVLLETVGFDREVAADRRAMHVGWVSGIPWATALLAHGRRREDAGSVSAATRVIDFICASLSPSHTFWAVWYADRGWSQSWSSVRGALHSRTLGEAAQFLVRALELGDDLRTDKPAWIVAVRANLDAVVARQRADGNLGSAHHAVTGEVLSWEGMAGLAWVGALAEATRWDAPGGAYLAAACRAGDYYASFVDREFLYGAPEDVDLAPTSEDGAVAVMAYMALYRRTGSRRWLDLARRAADWMLTFRYGYNTQFAPGTLLATYGFATRGADNASPANQHLHAYGLVCTAEMAELSAALGDPYYVERARETLACFRQFVGRFDGDFNAYRGMTSERYYQTACFQAKGMLLSLSHAWTCGVLLLACEQALADPTLLVDPT